MLSFCVYRHRNEVVAKAVLGSSNVALKMVKLDVHLGRKYVCIQMRGEMVV